MRREARGNRKNLYRTFNEVLDIYREIRIEKEVQFRFLEHIIELIEIGIIVFDHQGKVVLSNTAAADLTGVPAPRSWDHLIKRNPGIGASVGSLEVSVKALIEPGIPGTGKRLAVHVSRTKMLDRAYSLMAIQDIGEVVEQKETGAWIRLLRTLNHEIKNSVTPISSLADTVMMILQHEDGRDKNLEEIDAGNLSDMIVSVRTLQQRSRSLHDFIGEYHRLTKIPAPDPAEIPCRSLLEDTVLFMQPGLEELHIRAILDIQKEELKIRADRALIDQALINLMNNSMDALASRVILRSG